MRSASLIAISGLIVRAAHADVVPNDRKFKDLSALPIIPRQAMSALALSGIIFVLTLGGIFLGTLLRRALPKHHLSDDAQDTVRLGVGLGRTILAAARTSAARFGRKHGEYRLGDLVIMQCASGRPRSKGFRNAGCNEA